VLLLLSAAGEPTGRFSKVVASTSEKRPSRNDDLTIAMLVVRVWPYCFFKSQVSDLKSQTKSKKLLSILIKPSALQFA
jgi:hypothetical protein